MFSAAAQREAEAGGARSGAATEGDGAHTAAAPAAARTHTSAGRPSRVRRRGVVADSVQRQQRARHQRHLQSHICINVYTYNAITYMYTVYRLIFRTRHFSVEDRIGFLSIVFITAC